MYKISFSSNICLYQIVLKNEKCGIRAQERKERRKKKCKLLTITERTFYFLMLAEVVR